MQEIVFARFNAKGTRIAPPQVGHMNIRSQFGPGECELLEAGHAIGRLEADGTTRRYVVRVAGAKLHQLGAVLTQCPANHMRAEAW